MSFKIRVTARDTKRAMKNMQVKMMMIPMHAIFGCEWMKTTCEMQPHNLRVKVSVLWPWPQTTTVTPLKCGSSSRSNRQNNCTVDMTYCYNYFPLDFVLFAHTNKKRFFQTDATLTRTDDYWLPLPQWRHRWFVHFVHVLCIFCVYVRGFCHVKRKEDSSKCFNFPNRKWYVKMLSCDVKMVLKKFSLRNATRWDGQQ